MVNRPTNTSQVQRINSEDLPGAPDWINNLLGPLNLFIQSTNSALNGSLQLGTNIAAQINKSSFTTQSGYTANTISTFTPITYKSTLSYQTQALLLGQIVVVSSQTAYVANTVTISDWTDINGVVSINFITGLKPSTSYTITVLAF